MSIYFLYSVSTDALSVEVKSVSDGTTSLHLKRNEDKLPEVSITMTKEQATQIVSALAGFLGLTVLDGPTMDIEARDRYEEALKMLQSDIKKMVKNVAKTAKSELFPGPEFDNQP